MAPKRKGSLDSLTDLAHYFAGDSLGQGWSFDTLTGRQTPSTRQLHTWIFLCGLDVHVVGLAFALTGATPNVDTVPSVGL